MNLILGMLGGWLTIGFISAVFGNLHDLILGRKRMIEYVRRNPIGWLQDMAEQILWGVVTFYILLDTFYDDIKFARRKYGKK